MSATGEDERLKENKVPSLSFPSSLASVLLTVDAHLLSLTSH
jgi:hypothetical protein